MLLVVMLGIVVVGLSALKRRLLEVAQELSRKAPPVCCPVNVLQEKKMVILENL
jgi:hypothetical protein